MKPRSCIVAEVWNESPECLESHEVYSQQRELLDAWADGYLLGVLYRGALWVEDGGPPPTLAELRGAGAERYTDVLTLVARWRKGGVWALVLWEQSDNFGGGVFFSIEEQL